jgi:hypothetical protein
LAIEHEQVRDMLNQTKLRQAQADFLTLYPGGFADPTIEKIGKKHRLEQMVAQATEYFAPAACSNVPATAAHMVKVVSRSSMVSMFEKPRFRDFVNGLQIGDKEFLVNGLSQFLHGDQRAGFAALVDILATEKLAKWSLVTIIPAYYAPTVEVFVKPTTAKGIIKHFDVSDLEYKPRPSWSFYTGYRELINEAKKRVDPSLSPSNAAFSGFLMMAMQT